MALEDLQSSFYCECCNRILPADRASRGALVNKSGGREPVCKQCASFLQLNLFHLKDRIKAKGKTFEEIASQPIKRRKNPQAAKSEPKADTKKSLPRPASGAAAKGRMASAMEREAFAYRCLALERYIEGFVSGLEIGGIDRRKLSVEAVRAIDALLGICQKTRSERLRATSMKITRNLIRKLGRHIKESSVLTDEYVNAVKENADGKR